MIFFLAVFATALFGVYKYITAETNDYNKLVETSRVQGSFIKKNTAFIEELQMEIIDLKEMVRISGNEVSAAQDHMARMRKSQMELDGKSYPQKIELTFPKITGPIPIEVFTSVPKKLSVTRKVVRKTKTGVSSRIETRESPLIGDPRAKPVKKKKVRKKAKSTELDPMPFIKEVKEQLKGFES